jgi:hypothetical protein
MLAAVAIVQPARIGVTPVASRRCSGMKAKGLDRLHFVGRLAVERLAPARGCTRQRGGVTRDYVMRGAG